MNAVQAYNLDPILPLLLIAGLLATLPLVWVYRRQGVVDRRGALTLWCLFLTFDLVLLGAFTRLSDSGLGCPDWPGCYGTSSPVAAHGAIAQAQAELPDGPVTHRKAWIEMLHRYLAGAVGALLVVLTAWGWRDAVRVKAMPTEGVRFGVPWWPTWTLLWVLVQGAFGAWTVTMKLWPAIVVLHLLGAYMLLVLLIMQIVGTWGQRIVVSGRVRPLLWLALVLVVLQAASGAWVSANYAVLVCDGFPQCQGRWWPAMDFKQGFGVWRPLGMAADGAALTLQSLTAIHMAHRLLALLCVGVLLILVAVLRGFPGLRRYLLALSGLLALQVLTGLGNVLFNWPLASALLHTGGAGCLVVLVVALLVHTVGGVPERAGRGMHHA
ncbi:MAG: COX15/CtaA family protein [Rhodoferax sp.]|nr:COX15/CtaA family protein [Rhodoferax sp.]